MSTTVSDSVGRKNLPKASARPVPVLLMVRELGLGGIERDVAKLALGFDRTRFTPYVATYKPAGPRYDELQKAGVPILHLQFPSLLSLQALSAAARFRTFIRKHRIEIVHAFDPSSVFGVPLARLLRVPVVLSSQLGHRELHDPRTRKQLKLVDRWSDAVVVNCEALRRHLVTGHAVPPEKIELCYNGVETREFYPAAVHRPAEVADASLVVGSVCVLRPEKGLDLLQAAFARVRHLVPGCKLLIVGNGPELARLQSNAQGLGLQDACVFLPAVAFVAPIMRAIDIFVSCSHSEAFSNAILEAMACGCCVIGSRVGGTPELTGEDERGLLFGTGSVDELTDKLAMTMTNETLRKTLGEKAAAFAKSKLNVEANVERTMQIYDTLLERCGISH
ncbi:MAG: glycosyltransferase family 4 protein [Acidobacteriota bacterium]|nr:glycosyltransferase family 4 protein [Acidobacteriota bacterium]